MDLMYLENLDEFINDEKKIVTYRWLSLTLGVSSNIAKKMLFHYYDANHKKHNDSEEHQLSVTYLLSGVVFDEEFKQNIQKICVVRDTELEKVKQSFKQIFSTHIYSLQKVMLKDINTLYGIDYDKIKENVFQSAKYSSIVFPTSKIKSDSSSRQQTLIDSTKNSSPQKNLIIKKEEIEHIDQNKENKKIERTTQISSKKEAKGSLASMFANQTKKQEAKKPLEVKQESNSKLKDAPNAAMKKGSLFSFLTKDKPKPPVKKEEKVTSPVKLEKVKDDLPTEIEIDSDSALDDANVKSMSSSELKSSPKKSNNLKEKKNSQKTKRQTKSAPKGKRKPSNNANTQSKRQRIMILDDSSSESESEEELLEECPIPMTPPRLIKSDDEEDIIPPTPEERGSSEGTTKDNKRRKRKLVDKTFEDKDGFLVTKKEYEYVTDSDDENPIPAPKIVKTSPKITLKTSPKKSPKKKSAPVTSPKKSPKKKSAPVKSQKKSPSKSKQSTLTSFFTRK